MSAEMLTGREFHSVEGVKGVCWGMWGEEETRGDMFTPCGLSLLGLGPRPRLVWDCRLLMHLDSTY